MGVFTIVISILVIAPNLPNSQKGTSDALTIIKPFGIAGGISVIAFAFICQHNILLNYESLKDASVRKFRGVVGVSLGMTVVSIFAIGMAFLVFKEKSKANILNNFPNDIGWINFCRFLFALDMFFTYPLELFIIRDTLDQWFFKGEGTWRRHFVLTFGLVLSTMGMALIVCGKISSPFDSYFTCSLDMGVLFELTGGVAGGLIAFIIPSACYVQANRMMGRSVSRRQLITHTSFILFGVALMCITVVLVIRERVLGVESHKVCTW